VVYATLEGYADADESCLLVSRRVKTAGIAARKPPLRGGVFKMLTSQADRAGMFRARF
jgi:hypothetical protein